MQDLVGLVDECIVERAQPILSRCWNGRVQKSGDDYNGQYHAVHLYLLIGPIIGRRTRPTLPGTVIPETGLVKLKFGEGEG
jgi:hypothetical protein